MAFRFQKRIKILPGLRLNVSKTGISWTVGRRGASFTARDGKLTGNVGLPGTGLSYRKRLDLPDSDPTTQDPQIPHQRSGVRWADALSISVRPVITYWFMALYCAAKTAAFVGALNAGAGWTDSAIHAWTDADQALWAGVLTFWFLGRVFERMRS